MLSWRAPSTRILSLRPLRPPSQPPSPRHFAKNTQLLLLAPRYTPPRPQLPYLYQPAFQGHAQVQLLGPSQQIARLLSTETRAYLKETTVSFLKLNAYGWTFLFLAAVAWYGIAWEYNERKDPTPDDYRFRTRQFLRIVRTAKAPETVERVGVVDWATVYSGYKEVLRRLEDPEYDGKGLVEGGGEGEEVIIEGVGKAGFDISAKSWPWRAGYFEALMGCAAGAEHLENFITDVTTRYTYPKEFMIGPSNPDPRPRSPAMGPSPLEENCEPAAEAPEKFYMKILTGRGFTTKQRMEAASAYANWLEYKGLAESAEEMYRWQLDIAKEGLPLGVDPDSVIDRQTGVLKQGEAASDVTPNLLRAATELATHYARTGNISASLPVCLSVLRARRTAPVSPFPEPSPPAEPESTGRRLLNFLGPPRYPPPPPSGDHPLVRQSDKPTCEDGELMLYIGEILFSTNSNSEEGLGWTRQAVTVADANLAQQRPATAPGVSEDDEKQKCRECLHTGVANWDAMLKRIEEKESSSVAQKAKGWFSWRSGDGLADLASAGLKNDRIRLDALTERLVEEEMKQKMDRQKVSGVNPAGVWLSSRG